MVAAVGSGKGQSEAAGTPLCDSHDAKLPDWVGRFSDEE